MSPKFPSTKPRELVKLVEKHGFCFERQTGSHAIYIHKDGRKVTIPMHGSSDVPPGILRQIMKVARIPFEDFFGGRGTR